MANVIKGSLAVEIRYVHAKSRKLHELPKLSTCKAAVHIDCTDAMESDWPATS